ncbi:MAG: DNA polymerase III subunit epsilon [Pseudohongiella sp.]|nr:DNA polymerase III subunit epsilon [Pseudohongiella sp.]MDP2126256.1 DNA polymerase III subunit epsilon [Pseudohongiella sp.]
MRQIVLDTETTGLEPSQGHRIIEIGCVEVDQRRLTGRHFHQYIKPGREIDEAAQEVHGITLEFLSDKPVFAAIADEFLEFVRGAELLIHNAPFDIGFLDAELARLGPSYGCMNDYCLVTDTLSMARRKHPGQRNSLDALCKRYDVDNSQRDLHGALLDAEILADVYLLMSGGQTDLSLGSEEAETEMDQEARVQQINREGLSLTVVSAQPAEIEAHQQLLARIHKSSGQRCLWLMQDSEA